jgi:hypothetical protein
MGCRSGSMTFETELLVWQEYVPELWDRFLPSVPGNLPELSAYGTSVATAALSVPQIVHYILDGYIWRFDANPGLRDYLLGPPPEPQQKPQLKPLKAADVGAAGSIACSASAVATA